MVKSEVQRVTSQRSGQLPRRRVVLLGASNLMRGIASAVETARVHWGGPLDVLAATGSGRSYGRESCWAIRHLPGILECGLWDALASRSRLPTAALVTDIGNDILYGRSAETIAEWIEACLERLRGHADRVVITELPIDRIERLDARMFQIFRTLLFPRSQVTFESAVNVATELNERIVALAASHGAKLVRPGADWYGVDPIHIRASARSAAFQAMLDPWRDEPCKSAPSPSVLRWLALRSARPLERKVWRWSQRREQPAIRTRDGVSVSFF